jgi:hypothetical protein
MRRRAQVTLAALAAVLAGTVAACGSHSHTNAGSGTTTSTSPTSAPPTTVPNPQVARANARCLLGNDTVSAILGAPYGAPRLQPSGAGKVCNYQAASGNGHVIVTLRLGVSAGDFVIDRRQFELSGPPTKDWSGAGDQGFTFVNPAEHSATAGALAGNAEVLASAIGSGSLGQAEDLVKAAILTLITG